MGGRWGQGLAKGWGWKRQREGEVWGALCMNNSRKPWERAVLEIQWNGLYFPAGLVVKIPSSQCRGPGFNPWSGNEDPTCPMVQPKINKFLKRKKEKRIP